MAQQTDDYKMKSTQSVTNIHALTAVEWLAIELYEKMNMSGDGNLFDSLIRVAKQMEKEQIIKAYKEARMMGCECYDDLDDKNAEPYYNKTYNK